MKFVFKIEEAMALEVGRKAEMGLGSLEIRQKEGPLALEIDVMGGPLDFDEMGSGLGESVVVDVLLDLRERHPLITVFVGGPAKASQESRSVERTADPVGFIGAFAFPRRGEDGKAAHPKDRRRSKPADRRIASSAFGPQEGPRITRVDDHEADLDGEFAGKAHHFEEGKGFMADLKVFFAGVAGVIKEKDPRPFGGFESGADRLHGVTDALCGGSEKKEDLIATVATEFLKDLRDPDRVIFGIAKGLESLIAPIVADDQGDALRRRRGKGRGREGEQRAEGEKTKEG